MDGNNKIGVTCKKGRKNICSICGEGFTSKEFVEAHKISAHVPFVSRYACYACSQNHNSASDIKAHQLWHKLTKTPFQCPVCYITSPNAYALTRHLREHTVPKTPMELLVLDRECPLCKKTFLTNYFYNVHPCARRTRTCGGCNRPFGTESGYMRHAPLCPKIYLNHSKHIMPERARNEAQMRIKNEYGGDAEENIMCSTPYPHAQEGNENKDMQPVVVLERLASPLLRSSGVSNTLGKNTDRVSTKSYLKRVDQLLKNTMSTLVSIKHEPEVHIDDTGPPHTAEQSESEPDEDPMPGDDFHTGDNCNDSDEEAANVGEIGSGSEATKSANISSVTVKQELIDGSFDNCSDQLLNNEIKQEPFKLKLKITKNDGRLNSSLIDDEHGDHTQGQSKSAKKKKKRKHKERSKDSEACDMAPPSEQQSSEFKMKTLDTTDEACSVSVTIKQERRDDSYSDENKTDAENEPQVTVMTSIPMLQLESRFNENIQEEASDMRKEPEDVKPNRLELDRLMQITHIASGVAMAEETRPPGSAVKTVPNDCITAKHVKSTARKSTSAVKQPTSTAGDPSMDEAPFPQIVAVKSGAEMPLNIVAIKPEPLNLGYADESEYLEQGESEAAAETQRDDSKDDEERQNNEQKDEEAAYIESLNLSNVTIKQENDLHISDFDIGESNNLHCNGLDNVDDNEDDDSVSSADEAEENMDTYDDQEERIYREIELQPLEEENNLQQTLETQCETSMIPTGSLENNAQKDNLIEVPNITEKPEEQEKVPRESEQALTSLSNPENSQSASDGIAELQEAQVETSSPSTFGFVITNVCSQVEPLPTQEQANDENSEQTTPKENLEKCDDIEAKITCPVVILSSPKENDTLAQPFSDSVSTNYNCDEEHQNVLNHELSAVDTEQQLVSLEEQPDAVHPAASCSNMRISDDHSANEETENRINEQHQEQQEQEMLQDQVQQRCGINDDSNINEIAENNNNANIERELNDDANVAQEHPNII